MEKSAADDVQVSERLQPISVETEYLGCYKSKVSIRDLEPYYLDEPKDLGGKNTGPTPLENVLASLCACTSMIVHIMKREMGFVFTDMRCTANAMTDMRRVEMKRTGKKYSEVVPLSYHFYEVEQIVYISTDESDERLDELRNHVSRLCPVSRLLEDAGVPFKVSWVKQ